MSGLDMFLVCLAAMFGVIVTHIAMFVGGKWKPSGLSPRSPKPPQPKEDPAGLGLEDTDPMTPPPPVRPHPTVARVEAKREEIDRAILPDAPSSNDDLARILNERARARDAKTAKLRAALERNKKP